MRTSRSPIAYVVIGFFALLFGYFFYAMVIIFDQQSAQMAGPEGPQRSTSISS